VVLELCEWRDKQTDRHTHYRAFFKKPWSGPSVKDETKLLVVQRPPVKCGCADPPSDKMTNLEFYPYHCCKNIDFEINKKNIKHVYALIKETLKIYSPFGNFCRAG